MAKVGGFFSDYFGCVRVVKDLRGLERPKAPRCSLRHEMRFRSGVMTWVEWEKL